MQKDSPSFKTKKNGNKYYEFRPGDMAAVHHYLFFNNKTEAYKLSRLGDLVNANRQSLGTLASRYFNSDKIQLLLITEKQKFIKRLKDLNVLYNLKNFEDKDKGVFDISNLENIENIDKTKAIAIIEHLISTNKDAKTVKELMPRLIELKNWTKETPEQQTNIIQYEIPKKQII